MSTSSRGSLRGRGLLIAGLAAAVLAGGGAAAASPQNHSARAGSSEGASADHRAGCDAQRNVRVVLAAFRVVFSEHRLDQIDHFFAADFVQHSPYAAPGGRAELKQWWAGIVDAIPDVSTTVSQTVASCTDVTTFRIVRGTIVHDLPAFGISGHGQFVEFRVADIFRLESGKISAHWEVADTGPLVSLAAAG
jgi:predicted SnoaL-like aldol condensation-catalyzing enzyme